MRKFPRLSLAIYVLLLLSEKAMSQVDLPLFGKQNLINGYASSLKGENIPYFSLYPNYAKEALITKCSDGNQEIEWWTDPIPKSSTGDFVYFSWVAAHSTGSSSGTGNFDLYINDQYTLTFSTHKSEYPYYWFYDSKDGTSLLFELKKRDESGDVHGFCYLRIPLSKYPKGVPLKLKIAGQAQESNDWFMTFKFSVREKVEVKVLPILFKEEGGKFQTLQITALHFGEAAHLKIYVGVAKPYDFEVVHGVNSFQIPIQTVTSKTILTIIAEINRLYEHRILVEQNPLE